MIMIININKNDNDYQYQFEAHITTKKCVLEKFNYVYDKL